MWFLLLPLEVAWNHQSTSPTAKSSFVLLVCFFFFVCFSIPDVLFVSVTHFCVLFLFFEIVNHSFTVSFLESVSPRCLFLLSRFWWHREDWGGRFQHLPYRKSAAACLKNMLMLVLSQDFHLLKKKRNKWRGIVPSASFTRQSLLY